MPWQLVVIAALFKSSPPEVFFKKGVMQQKYASENMHQVYRTREV